MKKSFTLIEILVVIVVIGVLSAFILVGMSSISSKANITKGQVFSNSMRNSLLLNLISEWKMDGNGNDSWGTNPGATSTTTTITSGCVKDSCLSFNGTDSYMQMADSQALRMTTGGTISTWIYPKTSGEGTLGRIIDKSTTTAGGNGYRLLTYTNNRIYFQINEGTSLNTFINSMMYNQWQLVTVIFNGSGRKIYVNGIDKTNTGGGETALPPDVIGVVTIGNRANNTDYSYDGYIDEVSVYNTVFSTSQIQEKYYSGLNRLLSNNSINKEEFIERISLLRSFVGEN